MKFSCDRCHTAYTIADEKVGPSGVKARCKKCDHVIHVRRERGALGNEGGDAVLPSSLEDELGAAFDSVFGGGDEKIESAPASSTRGPAVSDEGDGAAQDPREVDWFVAIEGRQVGPVRFDDLKERWRKSIIGPDSLCWRAGLPDWIEIAHLPELVALLPERDLLQEKALEGSGSLPLQEASRPAQAAEGKPEEPPAAEAPREGWRPSAGSALDSLVDQELREAAARDDEAAERPEAGIPDPETTGIRVLLRDLPAAPPPEPSKFIPLHKSEKAAPAKQPLRTRQTAPAPGRPAAASREKKGGMGIRILLALVVLGAGGGALAYYGGFLPALDGKAPPPEVVQAAVEPELPPEAPPAAATDEGGAEAVADAQSAVGEGEPADAEGAADEVAEAREEEKDEEVELAAAPPAEGSKAAATPSRSAVKGPAPARVAQGRSKAVAPPPVAAPAPPPASDRAPRPAAKPSGDLLAAGKSNSIDALFEKELSAPAPAKTGGGTGSYIPPPPGSGAQKPKSLSQGDVMGVVRGQQGELRACANRYKDQGGTSGSVVMSWVIEPNGKTSGVKAMKGQEHAPMVGCLSALIQGWKFPEYAGPRMAPIEFPFQF